jgi:chaperone modulatory protein CbpM
METEHIDAEWLEKQGPVSVAALARLSGLPEADLRALVEYGALIPIDPEGPELMFAGRCVVTVQIAGRLRRDFELDPQALALALTLIGRIHALETDLRQLRVLMPHRSS